MARTQMKAPRRLWLGESVRQLLILTHDLMAVALAWGGAFWLRFDFNIQPELYDATINHIPLAFIVFGGLFWHFDLRRAVWTYTSIPDLERIAKVVIGEVLLMASILFLITRLVDIPRSVFPLFGILLLATLIGPRIFIRWIADKRKLRLVGGYNVLVVGAGSTGEFLVRGMLRDQNQHYRPVAFVDDHPSKIGREIQGIRVIGSRDKIPHTVKEFGIDIIVLALPQASDKELRDILAICATTDLPVRTLPLLNDVISGEFSIRELREVSIEDLLGRDQIRFDDRNLGLLITGQVVLITGGGGSIGSELCRQIAHFHPRELVVLDQNEFGVYQVEMELRRTFPDLTLYTLLGDVCDKTRVDQVFDAHKPHIVFHAAAYKHVPLLESQVATAVWNNVVGTRTVAEAAERHQCAIFTLISTDKAVNPTSAMGATKRVAEVYCQNLNATSQTKFITVRFGNVLDSMGSVVPLFREQIQAGGPVTVTHPEMTRYFMTIPEACRLITQAAATGEGGEIFVLDMGGPVKIQSLAEQMITISGKRPGQDIEIVFTGLRPGEKLHEQLFYDEELPYRIISEKILLAQQYLEDQGEFCRKLEQLTAAAAAHAEETAQQLLTDLVHAYIRQDLPKPTASTIATESR